MTSTRPTARPRRFDAGDGLAVLAFALAASTTVLAVGLTDARADVADARAETAVAREQVTALQDARAADDAGVWAPGDAIPADVPTDARIYEDGSWVAGDRTGCIPSALCDDGWDTDTATDVPESADDAESVARGEARTSTWDGLTVGEVIVCPAGWTVSTDDTDDGGTWAACM